MDEGGCPLDEENFEEAVKAVNLCIHTSNIPTVVKNIMNDSKCINLTHEVILPKTKNVYLFYLFEFFRVNHFGF